jgi:hypothetical protein
VSEQADPDVPSKLEIDLTPDEQQRVADIGHRLIAIRDEKVRKDERRHTLFAELRSVRVELDRIRRYGDFNNGLLTPDMNKAIPELLQRADYLQAEIDLADTVRGLDHRRSELQALHQELEEISLRARRRAYERHGIPSDHWPDELR